MDSCLLPPGVLESLLYFTLPPPSVGQICLSLLQNHEKPSAPPDPPQGLPYAQTRCPRDNHRLDSHPCCPCPGERSHTCPEPHWSHHAGHPSQACHSPETLPHSYIGVLLSPPGGAHISRVPTKQHFRDKSTFLSRGCLPSLPPSATTPSLSQPTHQALPSQSPCLRSRLPQRKGSEGVEGRACLVSSFSHAANS